MTLWLSAIGGGAPPPKRHLPPLKFSERIKKTIDIIAYCLSICSVLFVLLQGSLACERGENGKGEEEEELPSSHISIYYILTRQEKVHKLSLDFERKIR